MAHPHVQAYQAHPECEVVACADIHEGRLKLFGSEYGISGQYSTAEEMLAKEKLDIVSICLWPHLHAEYTLKAAEAGVKAIHCEKPMATTWGDARRMAAVCREKGVQLSFNHMRRFLEPFQKARELLRAGTIGELLTMEASCGDLYDWGTHWLNMLSFFNEETPAEWVIGQIDCREDRKIFGAPIEGQGLAHMKYRNQVRGLIITGYEATIGCMIRLVGTDGIIEVHDPQPCVRYRGKGDGELRTIHTSEGIHGSDAHRRGIFDLIEGLKTGKEPELSAAHTLPGTEIIFATYESSRKRGRVDLPLEAEDSAFLAMLESGDVGPKRSR
jgi:predicted dehydrogenase